MLNHDKNDRKALASLLLYCRQEAERQGLRFSAYLINMSVESLVKGEAVGEAGEVRPAVADA